MATAAVDGFPVPPRSLIARAGATPGGDVVAEYLSGGGMKQHLMSLVTEQRGGHTPEALRILDFGCGAGNVLRHFGDEARHGEVWGCDIDLPSVEWLREHLSPPFRFFAVPTDDTALPTPDDHFDLIYAISVFTHISENWADWLLELHRTLSPEGLLMATFLGEGMAEAEVAGPWDPDRVGMNVLRPGQDWDGGGPTVFLSDWWIRTHWGLAFEIVDIHHDRDADGTVVPGTHGYVVMRKRDVALAAADLEALDAGDPREVAALRHNIAQLHADDRRLRELLSHAVARGNTEHEWRVAAERKLAAHQEMLARSRSWRLTRPLRLLADRRGGRGGQRGT
jgi:SAM-dependent methyltransferase